MGCLLRCGCIKCFIVDITYGIAAMSTEYVDIRMI